MNLKQNYATAKHMLDVLGHDIEAVLHWFGVQCGLTPATAKKLLTASTDEAHKIIDQLQPTPYVHPEGHPENPGTAAAAAAPPAPAPAVDPAAKIAADATAQAAQIAADAKAQAQKFLDDAKAQAASMLDAAKAQAADIVKSAQTPPLNPQSEGTAETVTDPAKPAADASSAS